MVSYMHEDDKIHPAMIVVPGGGYRQVSRTEAHLVAMDFYEADYNVFVLVYTVNPLDEVPLEMQPLQDISRVIRMIRGKAEEYRITPEQIAVCGFSAGGHLCASLSVHWKDIKDPDRYMTGCPTVPGCSDSCLSGHHCRKGGTSGIFCRLIRGEPGSEGSRLYVT